MTEPLEPTYDPQTLHESYADPAAVQGRITQLRRDVAEAPDDIAELIARGELADLLRGAGDLDPALTEARLAVERAELIGSPPQQHTAAIRLAHVRQWRGEFAESDALFARVVPAGAGFGPAIDAFTRQHAGLNDYEQGRYAAAAEHFAAALALRRASDLPTDQIDASEQALAAARARMEDSG
jgi:tetratricopeptide (TPR) repeat protein